MSLADQACVPCRGGVEPMERERAEQLLAELGNGWELNGEGHLEKTYKVKNFAAALELANVVGEIAEAEQHHPDVLVRYGSCRVEVWTHKISGLTESDFYLAAKAERAWQQRGGGAQ